jgi:hypothetical protein
MGVSLELLGRCCVAAASGSNLVPLPTTPSRGVDRAGSVRPPGRGSRWWSNTVPRPLRRHPAPGPARQSRSTPCSAWGGLPPAAQNLGAVHRARKTSHWASALRLVAARGRLLACWATAPTWKQFESGQGPCGGQVSWSFRRELGFKPPTGAGCRDGRPAGRREKAAGSCSRPTSSRPAARPVGFDFLAVGAHGFWRKGGRGHHPTEGADRARARTCSAPEWRDGRPTNLASPCCDVCVLASWRGGGHAPLRIEAAGHGQARCLLTDIRGCRGVARHEREGLLVPPRDPEALARAFLRLAGDPRARREPAWGDAARPPGRGTLFREAEVADARWSTSIGGCLGRRLGTPEAGPGGWLRPARRLRTRGTMAWLHADGLPDALHPSPRGPAVPHTQALP